MQINRHNYEEFFILYMDNELDASTRREIEIFIGKNPDLKEELDLLQQFRLTPDTSVVYEHKEDLMSAGMAITVSATAIDLSNYEEWLVLYMDNELTLPQRRMVEIFVQSEPIAKKEWELLQRTTLEPEQIVFADKASLYRTTEKVRELPVQGTRTLFGNRAWRVAATLLLLLLAGTIAVIVFNDRKNSGAKTDEIVKTTEPAVQKNNTPAPSVDLKENNTPVNEPIAVERKQESNKNDIKKDDQYQVAVVKEKTDKVKNAVNPVVADEIKKEEPVIADNNSGKTNNLPQPINDPNTRINTTAKSKNDISKETVSPNNSLTPSAVTTASLNSSNLGDETESPAGGKKSKLRGILRKVTRTFEKRTNIDATDEDERLLVGGLAIKLK